MTGPTYCTILATNYLPKALALADSLARHDRGELVVLLIDAQSADDHDLPDLPDLPGVRIVGTDFLGLPLDDVLAMTTYYDLVEFATAVKPLFFKRLLEDSEQVFYLDPDTYLTSPMEELPGELAASTGGVLLTPHFLHPIPPEAPVTEGHLLQVGVYNLGFCGFDRRAIPALDWWWARLQWDCLFDYLNGLFVDQKWMDMGSDLFEARSLRHHGYNVGVVNLHERPLGLDADGFHIVGTEDRLRLFHFHAFDTSRPQELSTRFDMSTAHMRTESAAVDQLCKEYAADVMRHEERLPVAPAYRYWNDTEGRRIPRRLRRAWRVQARSGHRPPSPFVAADAAAWTAWRRSAWKTLAKELSVDAAKSARMSMPEEFGNFKKRFPKAVNAVTSRMGRGGMFG